MLDLMKLAQQMQGMSHHLTQEASAARLRLERAQRLLEQVQPLQQPLIERHNEWRDRLGFTAAQPIESLKLQPQIPVAPARHTVLATDGSQIAPSHHEIAYCYLLNVGRIVLHYGQNCHPLLDSVPEVFYRSEDLYISRQWGIRTEDWMGYRRTVSEAIALAELGEAIAIDASHPNPPAHENGSPAVVNAATKAPLYPTLAMVDGSLIHWFLEPLPKDAQDRILPPILEAWDRLKAINMPLVGYISAARSGESLNFLRLHTCPHPEPDCQTHCPGQTDQAPCHVFAPLRDAALWAVVLQPGQRSPLWRSFARILENYGHHTIYFCYLHVGSEIARLEMPAWVAENPALFETALSLTLAQVQKGYGYPVALAEAHNQAVVRGGDRARFFALLERQLVRAGLQNIGTSYKEARKRGSIA